MTVYYYSIRGRNCIWWQRSCKSHTTYCTTGSETANDQLLHYRFGNRKWPPHNILLTERQVKDRLIFWNCQPRKVWWDNGVLSVGHIVAPDVECVFYAVNGVHYPDVAHSVVLYGPCNLVGIVSSLQCTTGHHKSLHWMKNCQLQY